MKEIFVFHVRLAEISPPIWRRIEIRAEGTFWHLHCAIQDAMPWDDTHLHEFRFAAGDEETRIGIPGACTGIGRDCSASVSTTSGGSASAGLMAMRLMSR